MPEKILEGRFSRQNPFCQKQNPQADTSHWEREIDRLGYKLYSLTEEEVRIIEQTK